MVAGKPIIGIVGGIGSGKSYVARLFGSLGGHVIESDASVRMAFLDQSVREAVRAWWGDAAFDASGAVDRAWIAGQVFARPDLRHRLEGLIHPWIEARRRAEMERMAGESAILAFIWDAPLLFETGLDEQCDAVVFVDAPDALRLKRAGSRGWGADEWTRRENSQWPLDTKRDLSDYVVNNTAEADQVRNQVRELFPRILEAIAKRSASGKNIRGRPMQGGAS